MKNQFCYCSPLDVVCFQQIKGCLSTEKRYAIFMAVPLLPHEVKAMLGLFCL